MGNVNSSCAILNSLLLCSCCSFALGRLAFRCVYAGTLNELVVASLLCLGFSGVQACEMRSVLPGLEASSQGWKHPPRAGSIFSGLESSFQFWKHPPRVGSILPGLEASSQSWNHPPRVGSILPRLGASLLCPHKLPSCCPS